MLLCLCEWKTECLFVYTWRVSICFVLNQDRLAFTFLNFAVCKAFPVLFFGGYFSGSWFTACGFTSLSLGPTNFLLQPDAQFSDPAVTHTAEHGIRVTSFCLGRGGTERLCIVRSAVRLHSGQFEQTTSQSSLNRCLDG